MRSLDKLARIVDPGWREVSVMVKHCAPT